MNSAGRLPNRGDVNPFSERGSASLGVELQEAHLRLDLRGDFLKTVTEDQLAAVRRLWDNTIGKPRQA